MAKENIRSTAQSIFLSEARSLTSIAESLDNNFVELVELCHQNRGRIIFTGIGKNQHIGQKITATLNSTGTPSIFLHAGDALHGDMGVIQKDDLIIFLSKSGNSQEIKALIPLIKAMGNKIIGVVSDPASYLAKQAELTINLPVEEDACPHNLTPTNSSTAFLVFGDALAICLLELNNFTSDDYALFHPGGSLGKKLYLRVSDLYILCGKPTVMLDTSFRESILEISAKRLGATAVLDKDSVLQGIITDGDLRRLLEKPGNLNTLSAKDMMSSNPITIKPAAFAKEALNLMQSNNITQLLVVEKNKYMGVIHIHDILKEGIV
ncbi:MAG: KpsF/GutQ family sugar-phosphate isomerase [Bacteroidales bacterium]|nr:KpsF/GutQ family sugar-phosphate isomerase [Bacteroidales bacterium]